MMCAACVSKMFLFLLLIFVFKNFSRKSKMGRENVLPPLQLPGGAVVKNLPAVQEMRKSEFNSWVGRVPGGGPGKPLQDSCLEHPIDRVTWGATAHGVARSQT